MKKYSDSTLKGFTKDFLIQIIRCLENNIKDLEFRNNNQFHILMKLNLEKEQYRFHDLRKNPNDLPEAGKPVIYFAAAHGMKYHGLAEYDEHWYALEDSAENAFIRKSIYGWRYADLSEGDK